MLTVAEYADSRNISESTVKAAITRLGLDLPPHPQDKRKRLISLAHQSQLDSSIPKAQPPAVVTPVVEVQHYDRPESVGMVIAERAMVIGAIDYQPQAASDNPLYQALQARLEAMKSQNALVVQQVQQNTAANRDTDVAIDSLRQLEIIQAAQARAARDHHLEQQAYLLAKQDLQMQAAGLAPVVAQQPHPTPPPASQSSPPSSGGVRSSSASPF